MRIVGVPAPMEQEPDWVREAWVGLDIPTYQVEIGGPTGVNLILVDGEVALQLLGNHDQSAVRYWKEYCPWRVREGFSFPSRVCAIVA